MSADEPLVTRIEGMITRAKDNTETLEYQLEDSRHKLSQLEMAQKVAKMLEWICGGASFELAFCVTGVPEGDGKLTVVCAGGSSVMAQMRTLIIAMLDAHAKCLAEL